MESSFFEAQCICVCLIVPALSNLTLRDIGQVDYAILSCFSVLVCISYVLKYNHARTCKQPVNQHNATDIVTIKALALVSLQLLHCVIVCCRCLVVGQSVIARLLYRTVQWHGKSSLHYYLLYVEWDIKPYIQSSLVGSSTLFARQSQQGLVILTHGSVISVFTYASRHHASELSYNLLIFVFEKCTFGCKWNQILLTIKFASI